MYSPDHPDAIRQAQPGATNDGNLDFTGNGDAGSFWNTQLNLTTPDLSALQATTTSSEFDETVFKE